jgi:DNA-binding response OmpR family regulator
MANILLVDDQPYMGEFLSEELDEAGHHLKWVGDSDELLIELEKDTPDLILLDLFFNGFDGWSVLAQIKRRKEGIPVIILTAYDSFSKDPRFVQADGYVIKDIYTDKLKSKIAEVLGSKLLAGAANNPGFLI